MGESERAGGAMAIPAAKTSDDDAGVVTGEILSDPTEKTGAPAGAVEQRADAIANKRGMRPLTRP